MSETEKRAGVPLTEQEIEAQMKKSLEKIPGEIRKIKVALFFVGLWREVRRKVFRR
ncbi:MAG: hypothetical protein LBQ96_00480 [Fusobacteriaceae bacterium]|jgi:hypothetical protein|nr:hypothetical protein [Fusobacteriaceae bacterium]